MKGTDDMAKRKPAGNVIPFPTAKVRAEPKPAVSDYAASGGTPADTVGGTPSGAPVKPSFVLFRDALLAGRSEEAGGILAAMLAIDYGTALSAAQFFYSRLQEDPGVIALAQGIRMDLMADAHNDALIKIHQCFGLQGLAGLHMLQGFRHWLSQ